MTIDIALQFSRHPAGRVKTDGPDNGERFRNEYLVPTLINAMSESSVQEVIVDIDGCRSFGSSFLEEAFGGLSRVPAFPFSDAINILKIRSKKPHLQIYKDSILEYLSDAKAQSAT